MRLIIFLLLIVPTTAWGASPYVLAVAGSSVQGGFCDGVSALVCEDFEGAATPSGWTSVNTTGTIDYDYTTTALDGSESLYMTRSGSPGTSVYIGFTGQSEVWVKFIYYFSADPGDSSDVVLIQDSSGSTLASFVLRYLNAQRIYHGASWAARTTVMTHSTIYYVWLRYQAGTGANGQMDYYVSESDALPETADASITDGGSTANAARVMFIAAESQNHIFDNVVVSDTAPE